MKSHTRLRQKEAKDESWENSTSGNNKSSWYTNIEPIKSIKLTDNIPSSLLEGELVDVAVIGGGIAGLTTAYLLSKSAKKVAVIEDGYIGSGETGRTTAHITHALDDRYYNLEEKHGLDGARNAANSHTAAIDLIESIINEEKINCDFERLDGFLFLDPTDRIESLNKELKSDTQGRNSHHRDLGEGSTTILRYRSLHSLSQSSTVSAIKISEGYTKFYNKKWRTNFY
jgi:hypothetical protein